MNLLDHLFGLEPETDRLRFLYAEGRDLPPTAMPGWVRAQRPTPLGMLQLPHQSTTEVWGATFGLPVWIVCLLLLGVLVITMAIVGSSYNPEGSGTVVFIAGVGCLIGALVAWMDLRSRLSVRPEAARLEYSRGELVLLMLPGSKKSLTLAYARVEFQERWYVAQGQGSHWKTHKLRELPLQFSQSGSNLFTASFHIPADASPSYHTTYYRHEWVVAIAHVNWWGFTRTDRYLLWVGVSP